jgi:tetratricopeptide (TPR) repeat protein
LQTDRFHYIEAPQPELYELDTDPSESRNVAPNRPAVLSVLKEQLQERVRQYTPPKTSQGNSRLSAEASEKLRALGYVAYRSPVPAETLAVGLADPKTKVQEFNSILQAVDASKLGDFQRAHEILKQVQEKEPKLYLIPFLLGEADLKQGNWASAASELQRSLELNPDFDQAMTALARALHQQGQRDAAKTWVEKALKLNPENLKGWYQLGWMNLQYDPQAAIAAFQKALDIQPNFALARRDLGILLMQQQAYKQAANHLEKAAELGLSDPRLFNLLGIAYSRTNRFHAAIKVYRTALKADPKYAEAHLNLSYAYHKLNQTAAARAEYETACRLDEKLCAYVPGVQ